MSLPGVINQESGYIEGISAVPYFHNLPIRDELQRRLQLPVTIENDANCSAIAELSVGAAKNLQNVLFIVIGTWHWGNGSR
ncbi:ROK family protein [Xylocopilactobacillus apicola]|uniref:ROK family protein n=1 Tax=Xylocopilactobacillus apicola TaxID=2932184 RepID=A0AAU9D5M9_9LACO|nr:ROK family protein [Xylocopilactobacillus apicola]BDR57575.1 hypothetical protein XA3_00160 [Xylocopilactobacillus apicola]